MSMLVAVIFHDSQLAIPSLHPSTRAHQSPSSTPVPSASSEGSAGPRAAALSRAASAPPSGQTQSSPACTLAGYVVTQARGLARALHRLAGESACGMAAHRPPASNCQP